MNIPSLNGVPIVHYLACYNQVTVTMIQDKELTVTLPWKLQEKRLLCIEIILLLSWIIKYITFDNYFEFGLLLTFGWFIFYI